MSRLTDPHGEIERVRQACHAAGISCDAVMDLARQAASSETRTASAAVALGTTCEGMRTINAAGAETPTESCAVGPAERSVGAAPVELKCDPEREGMAHMTGIFVRAKSTDGKWESVDIAELDRPSLHAWLRSRGGKNLWCENVVLALLGHKQIEEAK